MENERQPGKKLAHRKQTVAVGNLVTTALSSGLGCKAPNRGQDLGTGTFHTGALLCQHRWWRGRQNDPVALILFNGCKSGENSEVLTLNISQLFSNIKKPYILRKVEQILNKGNPVRLRLLGAVLRS